MSSKSNKKGFNSDDLVALYIKLGAGGYESIPHLLKVGKEKHHKCTPAHKDKEQSWKGVKGAGLEKVIKLILEEQIKDMGLELVSLSRIENLLQIDYGEYGKHSPDVDLAVYQSSKDRVIAILSVKSSLRERATQTAYWRNKLRTNDNTRNVKVFFITPNSDDTLLSNRKEIIKQRAILENDVDATYIVNLPGRSIDDYIYDGKETNIRLVHELATDLLALSRR